MAVSTWGYLGHRRDNFNLKATGNESTVWRILCEKSKVFKIPVSFPRVHSHLQFIRRELLH